MDTLLVLPLAAYSHLPSRETAKAVAAAIVTACAYLVGVFPEGASLFAGFAALTGLQWLGLVLFLGAAYGLTYRVPNADR